MVTDVGRGWISHVACRMELRAVAPLALRLSLSRRYFHVGVVRRTYVTDVRTEHNDARVRVRQSGSHTRTEWDTATRTARGRRAHATVRTDRRR